MTLRKFERANNICCFALVQEGHLHHFARGFWGRLCKFHQGNEFHTTHHGYEALPLCLKKVGWKNSPLWVKMEELIPLRTTAFFCTHSIQSHCSQFGFFTFVCDAQ